MCDFKILPAGRGLRQKEEGGDKLIDIQNSTSAGPLIAKQRLTKDTEGRGENAE